MNQFDHLLGIYATNVLLRTVSVKFCRILVLQSLYLLHIAQQVPLSRLGNGTAKHVAQLQHKTFIDPYV